jgi:release factor glutamine methyltransferase
MIIQQPPVSIQTALQNAAVFLESNSIQSPRLEAEILLAHILNKDRMHLYRCPEEKINTEALLLYEEILKKRADGMPTAYLRGKKDFFSLSFKVGPGVLIPRAETELLVEAGSQIFMPFQQLSILDLGTGSGAILISLLKQYPLSKGIGVDISKNALNYAVENARIHAVEERAEFLEGNFFSALTQKEKFDLIVSNPPYIESKKISTELRFEPGEAFNGGEDGFEAYRKILTDLWFFLKKPGYCILEIDPLLKTILEKELKKYEKFYESLSIKKDFSGQERALIIVK